MSKSPFRDTVAYVLVPIYYPQALNLLRLIDYEHGDLFYSTG